MNEQEALARMVAPGTPRPGKYRQGVIQILVTSQCDKACFNCTQASQLARKPNFMTLEQFKQALQSLKGYWGVVGVFGGNPALHPQFEDLCYLLCKYFPRQQRGIWCNNPVTSLKTEVMRRTFDPHVSNLNVHMDMKAYALFREHWPESMPFGLYQDSRHSPPWVAMKDVVADEGERWELISRCDINRHWSALLGVFRGELRAWFCEVAGAQAILHQDDPDYPDTGIPVPLPGRPEELEQLEDPVAWWKLAMVEFSEQVRKHCHECGIPLRGYGELAQATDGVEQVSTTHAGAYQPKRKDRKVEVVTDRIQLGMGRITRATDYLGNSRR